MIQVKPTTKEQLVYYLLKNISLGTYDRRFLVNLQSTQIDSKSPVTSNQAKLLDKIILRYAKQLRRKEIDATDMTNLEWVIHPVESMAEFTDAYINIKDDKVEMRSPYKKDFINEIRSKNSHLGVTWSKETRIWSGPACEEIIKHFIKCVEKHYLVVHYCDTTKSIINTLADFEEAKYWDPTLVRINGNLYVVASNKLLDEAINDITLDTSLSTLARLVCYGIKISDELIEEVITQMGNTPEAHKIVDFATSLAPVIDSTDPMKLIEYLSYIKCDYVLITESFGSLNKNISQIRKSLESNNIPHLYLDKRSDVMSIDFTPYTMPVMINTGLWASPSQNRLRLGANKTVFLGNGAPIKIQ